MSKKTWWIIGIVLLVIIIWYVWKNGIRIGGLHIGGKDESTPSATATKSDTSEVAQKSHPCWADCDRKKEIAIANIAWDKGTYQYNQAIEVINIEYKNCIDKCKKKYIPNI